LELFSKKSRTAALILCIVFGTLGVHRAYLGKWWTGILQFLTFSIPIALGIASFRWELSTALLVELCAFGIILLGNGIWVVIDASRIVSRTMTDALGKRIG
jgi:TM2 domain-containing membrane protein YozV